MEKINSSNTTKTRFTPKQSMLKPFEDKKKLNWLEIIVYIYSFLLSIFLIILSFRIAFHWPIFLYGVAAMLVCYIPIQKYGLFRNYMQSEITSPLNRISASSKNKPTPWYIWVLKVIWWLVFAFCLYFFTEVAKYRLKACIRATWPEVQTTTWP